MESVKITLNDLFRAKENIEDKASSIYLRVLELIEDNILNGGEDFQYLEILPEDVSYDYFKDVKKVITPNTLSYAMARAMYEKNREMYNKIRKYYIEFVNNERSNIGNAELMIKLSVDSDLRDYIVKYDDLNTYVSGLKPMKDNTQLTKGKVVGRAIID